MRVDALLTRLDRVRQSGPGRWVACCPAHEDKSPSLSIRELADGRVLLHDFAGCDVGEIVAAIGLELSDLFPPTQGDDRQRLPRERRPFSAEDALRLIGHEVDAAVRLILCAAEGELSTDERTYLAGCAIAINQARTACGLREVRE